MQVLPFTSWCSLEEVSGLPSVGNNLYAIRTKWAHEALRRVPGTQEVLYFKSACCCSSALLLFSARSYCKSTAGESPLPFQASKSKPTLVWNQCCKFQNFRASCIFILSSFKMSFLNRARKHNSFKRPASLDWVSGTIKCRHCFCFPSQMM